DVSPELAFWRPAKGRHNIAEIALHHAYCVRAVRAQVSGKKAEAFLVEGEDWFALEEGRLPWPEIRAAVEAEQARLTAAVAEAAAGRAKTSLSDAERFDLALGITCHAVYHAGQIQLVKRLAAEE